MDSYSSLLNSLFVFSRDLVSDFLVIHGLFDLVSVRFELVLGLDSVGSGGIVGLEFLGVVDHLFDVFLG